MKNINMKKTVIIGVIIGLIISIIFQGIKHYEFVVYDNENKNLIPYTEEWWESKEKEMNSIIESQNKRFQEVSTIIGGA